MGHFLWEELEEGIADASTPGCEALYPVGGRWLEEGACPGKDLCRTSSQPVTTSLWWRPADT